MQELSLDLCHFIGGGFPETIDCDGKVLTKEDISFIATVGIIIGGFTGLIKLSSYPLLGGALGAMIGGMLFPISAHYIGKVMVATYEKIGIM
ncbi:hypothetical protein [Candidatus Berkiella aquae]|uniref:Uncharacterized protein n=1 Tax=Candidatus Berkiella aquae TaxID=295108 RepID=A0A0Q9YJ52_9GAMM|nr:hypothetical protein [Candidatus Berkiella aquae]MCS5710782.1 hypothetical protein [Candidatus Berkiella aquae]